MAGITRRRFMGGTAALGAGLALAPTTLIRKTATVWAGHRRFHPNVEDLRVVGTIDAGMTRSAEPNIPWARQEELVVTEKVWENMDNLAASLAGTRRAEEAWKAIFVKPPGKSWADTVVAVKTNQIGQQHTRSAVISRICHVLVNRLGVKPGHIHIYDACSGSDMSRTTPFSGLPPGCRLEGTWGGSSAFTRIPEPWPDRGGKSECLRHLVDGSVDVLVNIAMCKGHSTRFGGFTMAMKNHFGTFNPSPGHRRGGLEYLLAINRTPEILGRMDDRTGRVLYPRQQLCIVDGLWASEHGPGGHPSRQPNFLAMGVLAPALDYVVATRFRGERMGWGVNTQVARRMLETFGYAADALPNSGKIVGI